MRCHYAIHVVLVVWLGFVEVTNADSKSVHLSSAVGGCVPNATHTCYTNNATQQHGHFGRTNDTHLQLSFRSVTRDQWAAAEIEVKDGVLTSFGEVVMAEDEAEYMKALAKQVVKGQKRNGTILEIGFGMGLSATAIQSEGCAKHVIIEANSNILKNCRKWMAKKAVVVNPNGVVIPLKGFWESVVPNLEDGSFDGVFFDPFPSEITVAFLKEARRLLKPGGRLAYYSQEWGMSGRRQWHRDKHHLKRAGWTKEEVRAPQYLHTEIRVSCPEFPNCSMRNVTFIVADLMRAKEAKSFSESRDGQRQKSIVWGFDLSKFVNGLKRLPGLFRQKLNFFMGHGLAHRPTRKGGEL